jgi:pyruvate dehydrogenase E2 component (dihydrolipoamide acetyltransferase)
MPSLGADMEAGTLVAWRKRPGDPIARGEIIAEVETDKGLIEVECFASGTIDELLIEPGTKVPVGTKLASIRDGAAPSVAAEGASTHASPSPAAPLAPPPLAPPPPAAPLVLSAPATAPSSGEPPARAPRKKVAPRATPSARRLMRERGVELGALEGRPITRADLLPAQRFEARAAERAPVEITREQVGVPGPVQARVQVSPFARRLAAQLGVPIEGLTGSGPGAAIVAQDVRRAAQHAPKPETGAEPTPEARMRAAIGSVMARSKREIPHFYLLHTVDLGDTLAWLHAENERRSVEERVLLGTLFVRAVAQAVKKVPELNAHFVNGAAPPLAAVHVGVAVALRGGGLIAPAIRDADQLSFDALNRALKELVQRARSGQLKSSEMAGATITITSLGERGVESVLPVIVPPQVAMVGFGAPLERPMVVGGAVLARPAVTLALAADHRVSDGHRGAQFLSAVQSLLKEPPT